MISIKSKKFFTKNKQILYKRYKKNPNKRYKGDWTFTVYNLYGRTNPFNVYYSQRNGSQDGNVFLGDPLGSYQLSVLKGALVSLAYNFKFQ